jgi:transposase
MLTKLRAQFIGRRTQLANSIRGYAAEWPYRAQRSFAASGAAGGYSGRRDSWYSRLGPVGATLLLIKVTDAHSFKSERSFAAWLGLTPKNHSTAGKNRLGVITRAGDEMLRSVLVAGATAVIGDLWRGGNRIWPWLQALIARKPPKLVAIALANKMARIAWKLMISGERYRPIGGFAPRATPT